MKKLIVLLALLPCLAPAQEEIEPELAGTLKFANRDRISGYPKGLDAEGHLKWQASFLKEPISIRPSTILEMRLEGGQPVAPDVAHHALLTLTNGDTLRGQLDALDEEHVTLKTWYGGNLKIKRTMEIGRAHV